MNDCDDVMMRNHVGWARTCAHAGIHGQRLMWVGDVVQPARSCSTVTRGHDNAVRTLLLGGVGV